MAYSACAPVALRSEIDWTVADLSGELEFTITRKEGWLQEVARVAAFAGSLLYSERHDPMALGLSDSPRH